MSPEDSFGLRVDGGVRGAVGRFTGLIDNWQPEGTIMSIRRTLALFATTAALVLVGAGAASADHGGNPHFIENATRVSTSGSSLTVQFKEAGLSAGSVVTIELSADLNAEYSCVNRGNNIPSDPKKTVIDSTVSESEPFTVAKNGNLRGSLTISAPAASEVLDCPGGQTATLISGTWSNVVVEDLSHSVILNVDGTFSF